MTLKKGDLYRCVQAGGGGYGEPQDRDVNAVLEDFNQEKLTPEYAKREYGVVIDPESGDVNIQATAALRHKLKNANITE